MTDLVWVISSGVLILAVIALRAVFGKKLRPGLRYALWGLVLARLLFPGTVASSPVSVSNLVEQGTAAVEQRTQNTANRNITPMIPVENESANLVTEDTLTEATAPQEVEPVRGGSARDILHAVWLAGIAVTAAVFFLSNLSFYLRLRKRRVPVEADCPLRVYAVEGLDSSCLFGRTIYVTADTAAESEKLRHVLAHELSHSRHGDPLWAALRCLALALHWYNPLVWLAATLSRQDGELFADAGALTHLEADEWEDYGKTLIQLSAGRTRRASLLCTATTMSGGKRAIRERIAMIARRPRTRAAVVVVVVLTVAVVGGITFAGARTSLPVDDPDAPTSVWFDYLGQDDLPWDETLEIVHPAFPGVTFRWDQYEITAVYDDGTAATLLTGMPIWNAFFCDLTFDGVPELCVTASYGSGLIDMRVLVCEVNADAAVYTLEKRGQYDYALSLEDGKLMMTQYVYPMNEAILRGELFLTGGGKLTMSDPEPLASAGDAKVYWSLNLSEGAVSLRDGAEADTVELTLNHDGTTSVLRTLRQGEDYQNAEDVTAQPVTDILGYQEGFALQTEVISHFPQTFFYTIAEDGSLARIADSYGKGSYEYYIVDVDGDGVNELIANNTGGADGHVDVVVFQRRADGIWRGYIDRDSLSMPNWLDWGINSTVECYDSERNIFRVEYTVKEQREPGVVAFTGLENFDFEPYV